MRILWSLLLVWYAFHLLSEDDCTKGIDPLPTRGEEEIEHYREQVERTREAAREALYEIERTRGIEYEHISAHEI